jgi:hypothetical protein
MAEYRLLADSWVRIDPDSLDSPTGRVKMTRYRKGDVIPNLLDDEIQYLTAGARPHLAEVGSDLDPLKGDESAPQSARESAPRTPSGDKPSASAASK